MPILLQGGYGIVHVVQHLGGGELQAEVARVTLGQHARYLARRVPFIRMPQGVFQQHQAVTGGIAALVDGLVMQGEQPAFLLDGEGQRGQGQVRRNSSSR